jgi:catechol 2,3-dioxygenase-like lactoylglutathione lyase family enzyme
MQFNHTMLRIKDPSVSIPFYTDASLSFILLSSIFILLMFSRLFYNQVIGMDLIESEQILFCALYPTHLTTGPSLTRNLE